MVTRSTRCARIAARPKRELARALRREMTPHERALWEAIRHDALGLRVRRQHVILGFIVDFYIPKVRLAIEVDGAHHDPVHDAARDAALATVGVRVLRLTNHEVERSLDAAIALIQQAALVTARALA
ncbi:MAG: DUF559 domain-containing protein [Polyangiales bacterium]